MLITLATCILVPLLCLNGTLAVSCDAYDEGAIRLADGNNNATGRIEVCFDGEWGTVCDELYYSADTAAGQRVGMVICKQLGFEGFLEIYISGFFGYKIGTIWYLECNSGDENSLADCTRDSNHLFCSSFTWGSTGIMCLNSEVECSEGSIQLVNGPDNSTGRIEVCYNGVWGKLCDSNFQSSDAYVVCAQLGFKGLKQVYQDTDIFGEGPVSDFWFGEIFCNGNEVSIFECSRFPYPDCDNSVNHAVICISDSCSDGSIRLTGGFTTASGRIEVCNNGRWGTVCDDGFNGADGLVACRQLGFTGVLAVYGSAHFGYGLGPIWLDDLSCIGSEDSLFDCIYHATHNCDHSEDVGVSCYGYPSTSGSTSDHHLSTTTQSIIMIINRTTISIKSSTTKSTVTIIPRIKSSAVPHTTTTTSSIIPSSPHDDSTTDLSTITIGAIMTVIVLLLLMCCAILSLIGVYVFRIRKKNKQTPRLANQAQSIPMECIYDPTVLQLHEAALTSTAAACHHLSPPAPYEQPLCEYDKTHSTSKDKPHHFSAVQKSSSSFSCSQQDDYANSGRNLYVRNPAFNKQINIGKPDQDVQQKCLKNQATEETSFEYASIELSSPHRLDLRRNTKYKISESFMSCLIPSIDLKLSEKLGQGEFGVVYKGLLRLKVTNDKIVVAIKTLKGNYADAEMNELIKEAEKMKQFDHPHVLSLIGICVGLLDSPCIVMPFMSNGSLLSYLRKEAADLTVSDSSDETLRLDTTKQLLSMCLQVAKGMAYLTEQFFVHRDLAARNCMISADGVIKVADFGLAEDVYTTDYFKLNTNASESVKLPIKWMAIESLHYGKFDEKTDIWSYGVLCWEVFSVGAIPYPGLTPTEVIHTVDSGGRLGKPLNTACGNQEYSLMLSCWDKFPEDRPSFMCVIDRINEILTPLGNYKSFEFHYTDDQHII